jgi:hypothetical protein
MRAGAYCAILGYLSILAVALWYSRAMPAEVRTTP